MTYEDDQRSHFRVMLGDLCGAAELARLPVQVTTDDGRRFCGVPDLRVATDAEESYDDTGYVEDLHIAGETVQVATVVAFGIAIDCSGHRDEPVLRPVP